MVDLLVFGVHSVKADEITATEIICSSLGLAENYARAVSTDPGVLAAAVTSYHVDEPGRRVAVALYVDGERQKSAYISNDRRISANGHGPASERNRARRGGSNGLDHSAT